MEHLCLYWRFVESQGARVIDSSPSNSIGTLQAGARILPDSLRSGEPVSDEDDWGEKIPLGNAMTGVCECKNILGLSDGTSVTIELHAKRTGVAPSGSPVCVLSINGSISIFLDDSGIISLAKSGVKQLSNKKLPLNLWVHLALVLDQSRLSVFVDGAAVFTGIDVDSAIVSVPVSLTVGSDITQVTEVRVWSVSRTINQIREMMYSPIPVGGVSSKWKGFKIKSSETSTPPEVAQPIAIPFPAMERRLRARQVGSATPSESSPEIVKVDPPPTIPETREYPLVPVDVVEPSAHVEQQQPNIPETEPTGTAPREPTPSFRFPTPKITGTVFQIDRTNNLGEALDRVDNQLEIAVKVFRSEGAIAGDMFYQIAFEFSNYIQCKFRLGPYLLPRPDKEALSRLRVACQYVALSNILKGSSEAVYPRMLNCLRLPLLEDDLERLTIDAINKAFDQRDTVSALNLVERFISSFPNESEKIAQIRKTVAGAAGSLGSSSRSFVPCPACDRKLKGPLDIICECRSQLCVCYTTGSLVTKRDCVRCDICHSEYSLLSSVGALTGNRRYARSLPLPETCKFCFCRGSLSLSDQQG